MLNFHYINRMVLLYFRTNDLKEKIEQVQEEIRQLDIDIEENQGILLRALCFIPHTLT